MHVRDRPRSMVWCAAGVLAALVAACSPAPSPTPSVAPTLQPSTSTVQPALSAPASPVEDRPVIYTIYESVSEPYFLDEAAGASQAANELGIAIEVVDLAREAIQPLATVQAALAAHASGISISAPEPSLGPDIAAAAAAAGIPIVVTDDRVRDPAAYDIPFVGFSDDDLGGHVGGTACGLVIASHWLDDPTRSVAALVIESATRTRAKPRAAAERAQLEGCGVSNIVEVIFASTPEEAVRSTAAAIPAHPDVQRWVVVGGDDQSVKGALQALASAGFVTADVIAVGLGADEACKEWQAGIPGAFRAALYYSGYDVGRMAVETLFGSIATGIPLEPANIVPTSMLDATNWMDKQSAGLCRGR
jgi:L-arabinose transport system substrate-binding protein